MSHETQIQTLVMLPGAQIEKSVPDGTVLFDMCDYLEDCCVLYSVEQNKIVDLDDIKTDEQGKLSETIFGIISMQEIGQFIYPDESEWIVDWFKEGGWQTIGEGNMEALFHLAWEKITSRVSYQMATHPEKHVQHSYFQVSFIACWTIETSRDWETGITEVDSIDFSHEGRVVEKE